MVIDTVEACLRWKCRATPLMEYSPSELFNLYLSFKHNFRSYRTFFFGQEGSRHEPPVADALNILKTFRERLWRKAYDEQMILQHRKKMGTLGKTTFQYIPAYHILYETKLEEIPLYLNSPVLGSAFYAKWRLKLGR